jgi:hypothetical protein
MSILQDFALQYLQAGLHILALTGKKPNGRVHGDNWSWDDSFHGAPVEDEIIHVERAFAESAGTTGIAILIPSGMAVADVDTERAAELLVALGWQATEDTVAAITKNGIHVWFVAPGNDRNRWLGDGQEPDPTRTLLLKGHGGYVVAPPSQHFAADGTVDGLYEWGEHPLVVGGALMLPDTIPAAMAEQFAMEDQFLVTAPPRERMATFVMTPESDVPWHKWERVWTYGTEGLEKAIINAADGNQNNMIHWAAMTAREEGVPLEVSMDRLLAAAIRGGHPRKRAYDTIRGAYKRPARG